MEKYISSNHSFEFIFGHFQEIYKQHVDNQTHNGGIYSSNV